MAFIADPKNGRRVFDPERDYALTQIFRDVPKGEAWFDFSVEGASFDVKSNVSWSPSGNKCTYELRVRQLEDSFRRNPSHRTPAYQLSGEEFRAIVLPALRDAIAALLVRRSGDPRAVREPLQVDVNFIDRAPRDSSKDA